MFVGRVEFFRKKNVAVLTLKELFDFITDPTIKESNMEDYLDKLMDVASQRPNISLEQKKEDDIFKNSYIPYNMNDVVDYERDFRQAKQGQPLIYTTLHGIMPDLSKPRDVPDMLTGDQAEKENESGEREEETEEDEDGDDDGDEDEDEDDDEDEGSDKEESDNENEDGTVTEKKSKIKTEIHTRPRDESPNSRRVFLLKILVFKWT